MTPTIWLVAVMGPTADELTVWATPTETDALADLRDIYDVPTDGESGNAGVIDTLDAAGYNVIVAPYSSEWLTKLIGESSA